MTSRRVGTIGISRAVTANVLGLKSMREDSMFSPILYLVSEFRDDASRSEDKHSDYYSNEPPSSGEPEIDSITSLRLKRLWRLIRVLHR
ncbi:hypothetical protein DL93DRAFT_2084703 [Clavulina sp. PMI_390]|nr:hypothetical protein DL93DRAFT_2084703 [Clavulina sp. PMI_390]